MGRQTQESFPFGLKGRDHRSPPKLTPGTPWEHTHVNIFFFCLGQQFSGSLSPNRSGWPFCLSSACLIILYDAYWNKELSCLIPSTTSCHHLMAMRIPQAGCIRDETKSFWPPLSSSHAPSIQRDKGIYREGNTNCCVSWYGAVSQLAAPAACQGGLASWPANDCAEHTVGVQ